MVSSKEVQGFVHLPTYTRTAEADEADEDDLGPRVGIKLDNPRLVSLHLDNLLLRNYCNSALCRRVRLLVCSRVRHDVGFK
jgi:hypothetical protein